MYKGLTHSLSVCMYVMNFTTKKLDDYLHTFLLVCLSVAVLNFATKQLWLCLCAYPPVCPLASLSVTNELYNKNSMTTWWSQFPRHCTQAAGRILAGAAREKWPVTARREWPITKLPRPPDELTKDSICIADPLESSVFILACVISSIV